MSLRDSSAEPESRNPEQNARSASAEPSVSRVWIMDQVLQMVQERSSSISRDPFRSGSWSQVSGFADPQDQNPLIPDPVGILGFYQVSGFRLLDHLLNQDPEWNARSASAKRVWIRFRVFGILVSGGLKWSNGLPSCGFFGQFGCAWKIFIGVLDIIRSSKKVFSDGVLKCPKRS